MPEYDNTNSGALFKNDKRTNENAPIYRGPLNVDGKDYELSAWMKESSKGTKFMSLKVQEPFKKDSGSSAPQSPPPAEDCPF